MFSNILEWCSNKLETAFSVINGVWDTLTQTAKDILGILWTLVIPGAIAFAGGVALAIGGAEMFMLCAALFIIWAASLTGGFKMSCHARIAQMRNNRNSRKSK